MQSSPKNPTSSVNHEEAGLRGLAGAPEHQPRWCPTARPSSAQTLRFNTKDKKENEGQEGNPLGGGRADLKRHQQSSVRSKLRLAQVARDQSANRPFSLFIPLLALRVKKGATERPTANDPAALFRAFRSLKQSTPFVVSLKADRAQTLSTSNAQRNGGSRSIAIASA